MKLIQRLLFVCLTLLTISGFAQQKKFTSTQEAVSYINDQCNKYWIMEKMPGIASHEIMVYQHGFQLFFNEKTIFKGKMNAAGIEENEVHTTLTSINLEQAKRAGNGTTVGFSGTKKNIVTVSYHGFSQLNNKGEFNNTYVLPLDYTNRALMQTINDLNAAVDYLLAECYTKACRLKN